MINLLSKIYNQVKDVFVKPKLRFRVCLCKNAYFLPFNIYAPVTKAPTKLPNTL